MKEPLSPSEAVEENGKIVTSSKNPNENPLGENLPISRSKVRSVVIYELSELELEKIEKGSKNGLYLNFGVALLSFFVSFLVALLTCDFTDKRIVLDLFLIITLVTFILGLVMILLWYRSKDECVETIKIIKQRIEYSK